MKLLLNIDVDDIKKGIAFYTKGLGLRVGRRLHPRYVELLGTASRFYLLQEKRGSQAVERKPIKRNYARHWTPIHPDFAVPDIQKAVKKAVAAGAKLEMKPGKRKYGYLAVLSDPFGHGFCFIQFTGRGYDEE